MAVYGNGPFVTVFMNSNTLGIFFFTTHFFHLMKLKNYRINFSQKSNQSFAKNKAIKTRSLNYFFRHLNQNYTFPQLKACF